MGDKFETFNALPVGSVFRWGVVKFVKIRNADEGVHLNEQASTALVLDTPVTTRIGHYATVGANALCLVIKTPDNH